MKLPHLRHEWNIDEASAVTPRLRCRVCGKSKDAGLPADRRAVTEGRAAHAQTFKPGNS
jgi:hypothetical protein